jgi:hypothetical protein
MRIALAGAVCGCLVHSLVAQEGTLPEGAWVLEQSQPLLDKTLFITLEPDLTLLTAGERAALEKLLEAGQIFHKLYLKQRHVDAEQAEELLAQLAADQGGPAVENLQQLFWISKGPIATSLDNRRLAFLPVTAEVPGKNVYPAEVDKQAFDQLLASDPLIRDELLSLRHVVRMNTPENRERDRELLKLYPALSLFHAPFERRLADIEESDIPFYAAPYAVEYAKQLMNVFRLLEDASDCVAEDDPEFASYLRHRARDLVSGDYEAGDASWVTGRFKNLNAQIGSYETYDDSLYGVKAFYGMSILVRDMEKSAALAEAITDIQQIENALPYSNHKTVRSNIPVSVYNVVADFGQCRGTNTATILPNDAEHTRKYGRTILLRYNIMTHPTLFQLALQKYQTAMAPQFDGDLTLEAGFQRTLWHEIGHYLGVDKTKDGRTLGEALQPYSDLFEEMKADLVSLVAAKQLNEQGHHSTEELQAIYAGGILRVLQIVKPRREQPYQTMQLMQWNYFLENGLLEFDSERGELSINYDKYHEVVANLLEQVLAIQYEGNAQAAGEFVDKYTTWDEDLHGVIADRLQQSTQYRYRHVSYKELQPESD